MPSTRQESHILDTSSTTSSSTLFPPTTSYTDRSQISEIPNTPRSQLRPLTVQTPLFHVSNLETVTKFVSYKQSTSTAQLKPQLTNITLHFLFLYLTYAIPIGLSDTDNYYHPSDDQNIMNVMVSHYDCE